jgi:hypothetical protein
LKRAQPLRRCRAPLLAALPQYKRAEPQRHGFAIEDVHAALPSVCRSLEPDLSEMVTSPVFGLTLTEPTSTPALRAVSMMRRLRD